MLNCKKRKKLKKRKDIIGVFKHASERRKKAAKSIIGFMKFSTLTSYFFARLTLTLIFSFCFNLSIVFKKLIFRRKI